MICREGDLYTSIEDVTSQTAQDLNLVGAVKGSLKATLKNAFAKDKNRFEDSWRKNYLLLNAKRQAKKSKKPKSPKGLNHRERKEFKVFDIPQDRQKFSLVEPLHNLWCGYMEATFPGIFVKRQDATMEDLTKADYHGALLMVEESSNPTLVEQEGIVIRETKNMFHIITRKDVLKIIPKSVCTFLCSVRDVKIRIFGKNFCVRPADRIKKKLGKRHPIKLV